MTFIIQIDHISSQSTDYYFDQYRLDEGFTCKSVRDAIQDRAGYMYFSTENGLVRYNGHQFKYYREDKCDSLALQEYYCVDMEKDNKDHIWIMAGIELEIFDPKTETFKMIKKQVNDSLVSSVPYAFAFDSKRNWMWIACGDGLYVSKSETNAIEAVKSSHMENDDWMRGLYIFHDKVYGVNDYGLYVYDILQNKSTFYDLKDHFIDTLLSGFQIYVEDENTIYIGTWNNGIVSFNPTSGQLKKYYYSDPKLEHNGVISLYKDRSENKLWAGTLKGLYSFDLNTKQYFAYRSENFSSHYGVKGAVHNLKYDNQNGLWICGQEGLYRLDFSKQFISKHEIPFLKGVTGDFIPSEYAFENNSQQKDSILWIQFYYRELIRYDFIHKKRLPLPPKMAKYGKVINIGIFNLKIDNHNRLWYMTNQDGLVVYDIKNERYVIPPKKYFYKKNTWATNIYVTKDDDILICTYDGLFKMSRDQEISEFTHLNQFLRENDFHYIRMVDEDRHGNIILARASDGYSKTVNVVKYNPNTENITTLSKKDCPNLDKITKMEYMIVNQNDQVFIGSYNGVAIFDTDLDCSNVRYFNTENGLANESVYNFEESNNGRVWYDHEFGMTQYIPEYDFHQHITYFNSPLSMGRIYTIISPNSGILYNGVNKGFEMININKIREQSPEKLVLCDFKIDNNSVNYNEGIIIVSHNDFPIEIEVSLLQFTNSDKNTYYYTLNDSKKYELQGNILKFYKLPSGEYTINISGKNFYGREAKLREITLKVLPPFYKTWWFVTASALAFVFVVLYYYKLKDQHRQNLTKIRDNISKDLHDDLGSNLMHIKLVSEMEMLNKKDTDKNTFKIIAEEIKVVMDNMSDIVWLTQPQFDHLEDLMVRIKKLTVDLLEKKDIDVIWQKDDLSTIKLDINTRKQLYLALREIVNNCGKYSKAEVVKFDIRVMLKEIWIIVSDDGIGFDSNADSTGNGLRNIRARIEDCGGSLKLDTQPGAGVRYEIKMPLLNKLYS